MSNVTQLLNPQRRETEHLALTIGRLVAADMQRGIGDPNSVLTILNALGSVVAMVLDHADDPRVDRFFSEAVAANRIEPQL